MKNVLVIGGNLGTNKKIENLNFTKTQLFNIFTTNSEKIFQFDDGTQIISSLKRIFEDPKLTYFCEIFFISEISRRLFSSSSMRIRLGVALFGNQKPIGSANFLLFVKHICKLKTIVLLLAFLYGFFRLPRYLMLSFFRLRNTSVYDFKNLLKKLKISKLVLLTSGYDNISFLIQLIRKNLPIQYYMLIDNWDNPSSKSIIPKMYRKIGVWNAQQIKEIKVVSKLDYSKCKVIGSIYADRVYNNYRGNLKDKPTNRVNHINKTLLFIGQQNKSDEALEVLNLYKFIKARNSPYNELVYRPHPISGQNQKIMRIGKWDDLEIELDLRDDIDLREYDGIVCLPTTMLFEVVISKVPTIIYIPQHKSYRRDPFTMWKYMHFKPLKSELPFPLVNNYDMLKKTLKKEIVAPKNFSKEILDSLFPKFENTYEDRIINLLL